MLDFTDLDNGCGRYLGRYLTLLPLLISEILLAQQIFVFAPYTHVYRANSPRFSLTYTCVLIIRLRCALLSCGLTLPKSALRGSVAAARLGDGRAVLLG